LLYGDIPISIKVYPSTYLEVHAIATALFCQSVYWKQTITGLPGVLEDGRSILLPSCSKCILFRTDDGHEESNFYSWFAPSHRDTNRPHQPIVEGNSQPKENAVSQVEEQEKDGTGTIAIVEGVEAICRAWL
jgi:hypothetical protein